jgi:hypothetical protein
MKFLFIAMSLLSVNVMAQSISENHKAEICRLTSVQTKNYLAVEDCLKNTRFEVNCYGDYCIHRIMGVEADVDFSVNDLDGNALLSGYVEAQNDDRIRASSIRFSPMVDQSIRVLGTGDITKTDILDRLLENKGAAGVNLNKIASVLKSSEVLMALDTFHKIIRGSMTMQVNKTELAKEIVALDLIVLLQGEIDSSICNLDLKNSENEVAAGLKKCIEAAQKSISSGLN